MGQEFRFILLKGSKKYLCPDCGKKRFVPYVDTTTGQILPEQYGKCDRAINCRYHLNPYLDGYARMIRDQELGQSPETLQPRSPKFGQVQATNIPPSEPSYFPVDIFKQSRSGYDQNNFVLWLNSLFDITTVNKLISRYHIGTSSRWDGATVFWQIDEVGKIRSGKIMLYNPENGKRVKEPDFYITWAHKAMKLPDYKLQQCYFGTHLLMNISTGK